jgi:hypothetical protein
MAGPFDRRIGESRVAKVLDLIGSPPNQRDDPREGDLAGDFDYWFDGGACRIHTGSQHFVFADGTEAHLAAPVPWLNVNVVFPDGRIVDVVQRQEGAEGGGSPHAIRLDRLQG